MTPEQFRAARLRLGLSQQNLAQDLGTTNKTVSCWERGVHPIPQWAVKVMERME